MLGRNPGFITTQGQIIADLFQQEGYTVVSASSRINRLTRILDVIWTIFTNRNSADTVIIDVYSGLSFLLADAASFVTKLFRVPTVFVLRGGSLPEFRASYPKWVKRVLRRGNILVSPSTFLSQDLASCFSIRVVPNIIFLDSYPFRLRKQISPRLIWMRSFHPIYNPKLALDVFASIKAEYSEATLVMAGADKGLENEIKDLARRMGLVDSIRFPGFLERSAKIREFSDADIYLNTNKVDNMPVSVVEACAMGVPVIATNVGGISHLLTNGESGLLVRDNDAIEMAEAVRELLNNPSLAERLSKNGQILAEKSSWLNVRPQWEGLFCELADKDSRQRAQGTSAIEPQKNRKWV